MPPVPMPISIGSGPSPDPPARSTPMPTRLDPATALLLIDLQHGITALPTVDPSDQIVARGARLADAFRAHKKLVVATRVAFSPDGGDVVKTRTAANRGGPRRRPTMASSVASSARQWRHSDHEAWLERVLRNRAGPRAQAPENHRDRPRRNLHQHRRRVSGAGRQRTRLRADNRHRRRD